MVARQITKSMPKPRQQQRKPQQGGLGAKERDRHKCYHLPAEPPADVMSNHGVQESPGFPESIQTTTAITATGQMRDGDTLLPSDIDEVGAVPQLPTPD